MAVLQKIRTRFGVVISVIIALALLSFIIDPGTLESAVNSMSSKYDAGRISGKRIAMTDYQEDIARYTVINEIITGSSVQNEQAQEQIRSAAWQELLDKYMFIKNARKAGLDVSESELLALISGDYVSPIIAQNPVFADENGNFSVDNLILFRDQIEADESGRLRTYWNYLQNTVYTQQFYAKYGSLFTNGNVVNALQLKDEIAAGNTTADIQYVVASYPVGMDSSIVVSSKEIKDYYESHKEFFKQTASRNIEYVVFEVVPSAKDIEDAQASLESVYDEFASTESMKSFLMKNSDRSLSSYWYKAGELNTVNAEINNAIFGGSDLTPIVRDGNTFYAARTVASKAIPDSAYVKHILLQGSDAGHLADSLAGVVKKGGNFANLAAQYSLDQNSAADGEIGSIGWMTQTYMIPGFESVLEAAAGQPFVLTTQYGTHVVLVTRKTAPVTKKQVAILEKTAIASKETFSTYYAQANTFASLTAGTYEGYKKALDSTKVYSHNMNVLESTSSYGAIKNAKEVTRWVFDNKAGKASNIITVNNNYFFIAAVKEINKEGYSPVEKNSAFIKNMLYAEKLHDKTKAEVAAKIAGLSSLEEVAEKLDGVVESNAAVPFTTMGYSPVEAAVIGAASTAEEGRICGPVAGARGVYVFQISNKNVGEYYTEADAQALSTQKSQYASQMIIPVMMQNDNVVDNRARFF